MLSSISSSNQRLPALPWTVLLGAALVIYVAFVCIMELRLGLRGFHPTASDSEALWLNERARASRLGDRALILIGGSRIQLGADLNVLRSYSVLEPVQLAIDGSSFLPIFAGLALDPSIRGTVIVDFSDHLLIDSNEQQISHLWQSSYDRMDHSVHLPDFNTMERWLANQWRKHLRSYADSAQPISSLLTRLLPPKSTPQYLVTLSDRSRQADYSKVDMPGFYYRRVIRNLGQDVPITANMTYEELDQELQARIEALQPQSSAIGLYEDLSHKLASQAATIRERGGQVYFVVLPKNGLVKAIDDRRFPRPQFWDRFTAIAQTPSLHFEDVPALRELNCPDGSHLDYRHRARFTLELARALGLDKSNKKISAR